MNWKYEIIEYDGGFSDTPCRSYDGFGDFIEANGYENETPTIKEIHEKRFFPDEMVYKGHFLRIVLRYKNKSRTGNKPIPIKNLDTGIVYRSYGEAALNTGIDITCLSMLFKRPGYKKRGYIKSHGYRWRKLDDC